MRDPQSAVRGFYVGEAAKLATVVVLFVVVLRTIEGLAAGDVRCLRGDLLRLLGCAGECAADAAKRGGPKRGAQVKY